MKKTKNQTNKIMLLSLIIFIVLLNWAADQQILPSWSKYTMLILIIALVYVLLPFFVVMAIKQLKEELDGEISKKTRQKKSTIGNYIGFGANAAFFCIITMALWAVFGKFMLMPLLQGTLIP